MDKFIEPVSADDREFFVPGDKSITHRAVMFNSMTDGEAAVTGGLLGEDCISTINCMRALGAKITVEDGVIKIKGAGKFCDGAVLDAGNSGTTMRLLAGLLAGAGVNATISGDESLSRRPMKRVTEPLYAMGADISGEGGHAPLAIKPAKLRGIEFQNVTGSAQVKSAVLLAGLYADGKTTVFEDTVSRNHTENMLGAMGAKITAEAGKTTMERGCLTARDVIVPGDISSAAFLLCMGAIIPNGSVTVKNTGVNPTRSGILNVLERMGAEVTVSNRRIFSGEPVADITVRHKRLDAFTVGGGEIPALIDELPVIAVTAAFCRGRTVISDAGELRVKETDRIKAVADNLAALGADITATADGWIIDGRGGLKCGAEVDSYGDHRIAMSMAVAGWCGEGGVKIKNAECVNISFPDYFEIL